jgi:predicted MPP superfamily phosphohydrolase
MPLFIIASLLVFQALLVIVHLALYGVLNAAFGIGGTLAKTLFVVLSLTFVAASLLTHSMKGKWVDWFYTAAAYWFGLVNFLFAGVVMFFFASYVLYARNDYVSPAVLAGISLGLFFLLHLYGTWASGRAGITHVRIVMTNLPEWWRGKTAVFVSDIHLGNVRGSAFAEKVAKKIAALAPQAVFIGGDLYDGSACDAQALIEPLQALHAPQGIYFVTGNHEFYLPDMPVALAAIRNAGVTILENETVELHGLTVAGVDNQATHRKDDFARILQEMKVPRATPAILLKHEPSDLQVAHDAGMALVLSGHTHRGQIFPLNFFTRQIYHGFDYGLKRLDDMQVYTSSGVGTWGPPLRLGTKSEIVQITFS